MLQEKGGGGFPYVIFMDQSGAVLTDSFLFPESLEVLDEAKATAMKNAKELDDLRAKAKANPKDEAAAGALKLALALRRVGKVSPEEFAKLEKLKGIPKDLIDRYKVTVVANQLEELDMNARRKATSREEYEAALLPAVFELFKSGARLPIDHEAAQTLYGAAFDHAIAISDPETGQKAYDMLEKTLLKIAEDRPQYALRIKKDLKDRAKKLAELAPAGAR